MKVELVKILTILELTGGRFSREPAKMRSMVRSSMVVGLGGCRCRVSEWSEEC